MNPDAGLRDAIDLDAFRRPTSDTGDYDYTATVQRLIEKKMVGGFIVNKEILYEFSRVLYVAKDSEMAHIDTKERKYLTWIPNVQHFRSILSKCESWSRLWNSRKQRTSQLFISPTSSVPQIHVNGVRTRTYRCVLLILISLSIEWLLNKTLVLDSDVFSGLDFSLISPP